MLTPKLFISPISKNTIEAVIYYSTMHNIPLGLIPSRRQVDYSCGYVMTTSDLADYIQARSQLIVLQRDHGGPGQGMMPDDGHISFNYDISNKFDIIHIDPFKEYRDITQAAEWTKRHIECYANDNRLRFEVGTEEAIFKYSPKELEVFLDKLGDSVRYVEYVVVQAGGRIDGLTNLDGLIEQEAAQMIELCHARGLKTKEHNGDFLPRPSLRKRFELGLDAINIGPELGVLETSGILLAVSKTDRDELVQLFVESGKWKKWLPETATELDKAYFAGHYNYTNPRFYQIIYKYPGLNAMLIGDIIKRIAILYEAICGK